MRSLFRLFLFLSAILVGLITIIKFVQGCSWKDAVGIVEQLWKEIMDSCGFECRSGEEKAEEA